MNTPLFPTTVPTLHPTPEPHFSVPSVTVPILWTLRNVVEASITVPMLWALGNVVEA